MQKRVLSAGPWRRRRMETGGPGPHLLAGDLLNQCIGTSFGLRDFGVPLLRPVRRLLHHGGEPGAWAPCCIDGGFARRASPP